MKRLFLAAVGLVAVTSITAQQRTHFGLKGGVNIANLQIEGAGDGDSRIGFHVGGLAHIHVSRHFAVQPELFYSAQGRRATVAGVEYKTNLDYINMPVLAQYMTGSGFRLQTGPQLGILVSARTGVEDDVDDKVGDNYKTPEISWVFGASYLTNSGFGFDARYNLGLSNINDAGPGEVKNRVVALGVFYQFMHNR